MGRRINRPDELIQIFWRSVFSRCIWVLWLTSAAVAFSATNEVEVAEDKEPSITELKKFSLEELMEMEVTLASRTPEPLSKVPAAIAVITGDDIRRTGVTSIPEALRLAPGLEVARLNSTWAISSRGFNDQLANKLLVLMDGRSVYTPLFAGVYWAVQDTMLEDIDRIEVIRGPGATLWGANAVNGVINIITKSAKETQGLLIAGGGGTEEIGFGEVRYGLQLNEKAFLRFYGKYFNRDDSKFPDGSDDTDRWEIGRGGFRMDWEPTDVNLFTLQGDVYGGFLDEADPIVTFVPPFVTEGFGINVSGGNLLGRWTRTFSEESDLMLQVYYDRTRRKSPPFGEDRDIGDIDFQHRFQLGSRQQIIWGLGYRLDHDHLENTLNAIFLPDSRTTHLFSAFVQDEITLVPDKWKLILGSKFEHNSFTGFEIQPSVRLLWTPLEHHTIWAAVSRALRTPSRADDDVILNAPGVPPGTLAVRGQRGFDSEELIAYELGYRVRPHDRLSLDLATFYNDYDDLLSVEPATPSLAIFQNEASNESYGFELAATYQAAKSWRLSGGYTFLESQSHLGPFSLDLVVLQREGSSPHHQFFLRSSADLGKSVELDAMLRYVDNLISIDVPSYFSLDVRLGWKWGKHTEISIVGQNLLDNQHLEFRQTVFSGGQTTEVERSIYGKITWRF